MAWFEGMGMMLPEYCPICEGRTKDVEDSEDVCDIHQSWVVTACRSCDVSCFSIYPGKCMDCELADVNGMADINKLAYA